MPSIEQRIKQLALDAGFDLVGISSAENFSRDEVAATERVRQGLMDGLPWYTEDRVRRMNRPAELLQGARSVISLAISYDTGSCPPSDHSGTRTLRGKVARYAWGADYHSVIKERLRRFAAALPNIAGKSVASRVFVDDGPMNDRAAAERSGVGWFGKNTNILTTSHGSWVFLSQVVTDLDLAPDMPLKKTCGSCVLCIDDCPTGAIVAPYVLDNRRCISFLTIELRGPIPRELRPLVSDWVFGCDICQEVCPVNRKSALSQETAFKKRHDFNAPELLPLLDMDDEAFRARFRSSPIKRAKLAGLQRNVCVALGNIGDPAAVPALIGALSHGEPLVRQHAAWALGRIGGSDARQSIASALGQEQEDEVREELELAMAEAGAA